MSVKAGWFYVCVCVCVILFRCLRKRSVENGAAREGNLYTICRKKANFFFGNYTQKKVELCKRKIKATRMWTIEIEN